MTTSEEQARGLLLAGGRSRRMGQDKRLLSVGGQTLVAHAYRALSEVFGDPWVLVADDGDVATLTPLLGESTRFLLDTEPGEGPLPALIDAFEQLDRPCAFLLATDMPGIDATVLRAFDDWRRRHPPTDATVPVSEGKPQVTCAFYRSGIVESLRAARAEGRRCLVKSLKREELDVRYLSDEEVRPLGGESVFSNLNTPRDRERFLMEQRRAL